MQKFRFDYLQAAKHSASCGGNKAVCLPAPDVTKIYAIFFTLVHFTLFFVATCHIDDKPHNRAILAQAPPPRSKNEPTGRLTGRSGSFIERSGKTHFMRNHMGSKVGVIVGLQDSPISRLSGGHAIAPQWSKSRGRSGRAPASRLRRAGPVPSGVPSASGRRADTCRQTRR